MVAMAQHLFERVEHWWVDRVLAIARGTLARAEKGFSDWRARQRQMHELAGFSPHEIDLLARDVGVRSGDELAQLVRAGPHGAELLPKMAKLLGAELPSGAELRRMQLECALCEGRCVRDLAAGRAAVKYAAYCRNADTLAPARRARA